MDFELQTRLLSSSVAPQRTPPLRAARPLLVLALALVIGGCGTNDAPNVSTVMAAETPTARALASDRSESVSRKHAERAALKLANAAYLANHIVAPAGDNALEHALKARDINVDSAGAAEMLTDIAPTIAAQVQAMINAGNLAEADRVLNLLRRASPDSLTTLSLQRQRDRAARPLAMGSVTN